MKFVTDNADYEMMTVLSAVRRDRDSWSGWGYMRLVPDAPLPATVLDGVRHFLEGHIGERDGAVFLLPSGDVIMFCKDISAQLLERLGDHVVQFLFAQGIAAGCTSCEVVEGWQGIVNSFSYSVHASEGAPPQVAPHPPQRRQLAAARESATLDSCRVLLVEDDPVTRWLVRGALKGACTLWTAQGARAAVSAYQAARPDIVFLDLNLPDGHGSEVMRQILKRDPGAYIVVFSSHDSLDNIVSMLENGARGFVAKPFSRDSLMGHVRSFTPAA